MHEFDSVSVGFDEGALFEYTDHFETEFVPAGQSEDGTPLFETVFVPVMTTALAEFEKFLEEEEIVPLSFRDADLLYNEGISQENLLELADGATVGGEEIECGVFTAESGTVYEITKDYAFRLLSELKDDIIITIPDEPDQDEKEDEPEPEPEKALGDGKREIAAILKSDTERGSTATVRSAEDEYELTVSWVTDTSTLTRTDVLSWVLRDSDGHLVTDEDFNGEVASGSYEITDHIYAGSATVTLTMVNDNDVPIILVIDEAGVTGVSYSGTYSDGEFMVDANTTATAVITVQGTNGQEETNLILEGIHLNGQES